VSDSVRGWQRSWARTGGSSSNIVTALRHAGAASVPPPLTGGSSGVGDGEAAVLGNGVGCSEWYGVAAKFEGDSSGVGDGEAAVSGKAGDSSGAG